MSTRTKLVAALNKSFPQAIETGKTIHLLNVHAPKYGHGKVVNFVWNNRFFRITSNMKVQEYNFGFNARFSLRSNDDTRAMEKRIDLALKNRNVLVRMKDVKVA